jgi:hypothetical protein
VVLARNIHGVWIKVNVIHDIGANVVQTYINGRLLATGDGEAVNAGTDGWYHKYGCYGTLRTGSAKVEWRNVKHFRDGTPPPASDGGAATGARDAGGLIDAPVPDAGAGGGGGGAGGGGGGGGSGGGGGGSGGGGGEGGSGGSGGEAGGGGGRGGRGGGGGSGGSSPPSMPPLPEGGCSCSTGGHPTGGWLPLVLFLLAVLSTRLTVRRRT